MKMISSRERRGHSRVILDLPLDYQVRGSRIPCAGIVRNASEVGLLICSLREIPVGTELDVDVLFVDEYELSHFEGRVKVVRAIHSENGKQGHLQGVKIVGIDEANYRRFKRLLIRYRDEMVNEGSWLSLDIVEEDSLPTPDDRHLRFMKKSPLERFF